MEILKPGKTGTNVKLLQLALMRAGFFNGEIDGKFGPVTQKAVIDFQKANKLTPDGIVGKYTWSALIPYLKGYTIHRVQSGDTLWKIALMHNADVRAIMAANPTVDPLDLQIGSLITVPFRFSLVPTDVPYTSQLVSYICEGLIVRYPFIKAGTIGRSVMGREIPYLKIGAGSQEVFYNASHHANEWITTPVLLKFLEEYAAAYTSGEKVFDTLATELFNKATLYLVPLVNPDGVDLVNGVIPDGKYLAQAKSISARYPEIPYPNGWKANIAGVDLNLQYPANWEKAKEIKYSQGFTTPAPRDFVGSAPITEPESFSVYNFTLKHDFKLTLSYHSQGKLIYWKYLDFEPKDSYEIAQYFGEVSGYTVEETPFASGFAGYKDWFIENYDRPGYTIEVGIGASPLPLSQFDEIYRDNIGILTGGITQI